MLDHLIYLISLCFVYNLSNASEMISIGLDNCKLTYEVLFTFHFKIVEFPWVLIFELGISNFKIVAHNFAEFLEVKKLVFSRTSKGNVTNLKFTKGGGRSENYT